jgi:hypothetical protein
MLEIIEGICQFPQRGACTESERKASQFVFDVMEQKGMKPGFVDFETWPDFYKVYAGHMFLAAFVAIFIDSPMLLVITTSLLMVSWYGDLTFKWYWLRRLFRKGQSRHVIGSLGPDDAKRTIILTGHHDAGQTSSVIFEPEGLRRQIRFWKEHFGIAFPQYLFLMGAFGLILLAGFIRLGGNDSGLESVLLAVGSIILLIAGGVHLTMWGKGFAGGASDNASGVAAAIETAMRLKTRMPKDTRIVVVSFGAEETMVTGSALMVKSMFADYDRENTYVINLDGVGGGDIRFVTGEGLLQVFHYDAELITAARKVARLKGFESFRPYVIRAGGTDALPFKHAGFKAIMLLGLDEDDVPPNYHWHTDTPENIDPKSLERAVQITEMMVRGL